MERQATRANTKLQLTLLQVLFCKRRATSSPSTTPADGETIGGEIGIRDELGNSQWVMRREKWKNRMRPPIKLFSYASHYRCTSGGEQRAIYEGVYTIEGHG
jgi:hypothetical protein